MALHHLATADFAEHPAGGIIRVTRKRRIAGVGTADDWEAAWKTRPYDLGELREAIDRRVAAAASREGSPEQAEPLAWGEGFDWEVVQDG